MARLRELITNPGWHPVRTALFGLCAAVMLASFLVSVISDTWQISIGSLGVLVLAAFGASWLSQE